MCEETKKKRKKLKEWVLAKSKGNHHYEVVLKNGCLTQETKAELFGKCTDCQFNNGEKLEVGVKNPLDPSIKPRVNCAVMNGLWVTPIKLDGKICNRLTHVENKKMARPHNYAEHAMARATAASAAK